MNPDQQSWQDWVDRTEERRDLITPAPLAGLAALLDIDVMAVIIDTLEQEGYRLLTASDGETALRLARDARPDLVVLDWMMPGRDGLSVCRALRQDPDPKVASMPVVLITGRADAQDTAAGFEAGVTDYLTKPFKPTHLLARLQSWLIRSQGG